MALKEEKVLVSSGKKKASVRNETNAESGMRGTIVPKNQNTLPQHLPSHPSHEVDFNNFNYLNNFNNFNNFNNLNNFNNCKYSNMSTTNTFANEDKTTGDAPTAHTGLAPCSRCHPAWASEGTLVFPGKNTHGTPVPTQ